ncbi:protein teashirt [Anastrepha ludens]|uniref:protein teashirt n=1 Tax=Anastrepha ludens TaxID=28586 RepID=UPI0023B15B17|nr:protein teashirt [Anastrepha ludens]XP_053958993.1 protein teashirt [Anastrepha ludens]
MLHEALMLEIYRQALNAGALPTARPRSTESANSSERCPSHDSNSSENGRESREMTNAAANAAAAAAANAGMLPLPPSMAATFPAVPQNLPAQPPSMEAYLQMVAAAAQQYGFPLGAAAAAAAGPRFQLPLPTDAPAPFKLPPQASPTASSNNSEALDFRTNLFGRTASADRAPSEEEEDDEEANDANNPLDLSVGTRKRSADGDHEPDSTIGQIHVKKIFKTDSPPLVPPPTVAAAPLLPAVNPYLAAVAAANIFRTGQFPDWNGKNDLVIDPLEKMSDIVKGPRKEKSSRSSASNTPTAQSVAGQPPTSGPSASTPNSTNTTLTASTEGMSKARHNIWQSHWQNKGVASSVFRCVWCKQSFSTLEALTTHMKDSKHCGVNVPPFGNLPNTDRHHQPPPPQSSGSQHSHNLRKPPGSGGGGSQSNSSSQPSAAAKNAFQYRGDPPTPLPRKLVRGQNVWLGKGVEQAMQILKCMRCGESFRSLGEMTKHMQETQHYTNILSQEQTISMKSSGGGDAKDGQNSLSSEESRTLSAVLTCKVCDKAFNSLGDLSNHMAKNNHYAEPLMQSMSGGAGSRKRPAPKKREKSLPVRKLLEMKGAQNEAESMEAKMQRSYENTKRMPLEGTGIGPGNDKSDAALFAERMRQYITGVKADDEAAKSALSLGGLMNKTKSPDLEPKNGTTKSTAGSSSVLSAIEQMFTTSFDTPPRHASLPATSPSNSSTKNTSPVASSILKRLGIDETVDYNKPLIDTSDPYYQHYRYTSSERSGSECSAETHVEARKMDVSTPEKMQPIEMVSMEQKQTEMKRELEALKQKSAHANVLMEQAPQIKMEIKSEIEDEERGDESPQNGADGNEKAQHVANGADFSITNNNNNNNNNKERSISPPKSVGPVSPVLNKVLTPRSPTDSHRSATPRSPASSIKSYDGEKKYPSDSLNALSSMFDSLGSSSNTTTPNSRTQASAMPSSLSNKIDSPENLTTSNSLAALRQFCIKKEKTA